MSIFLCGKFVLKPNATPEEETYLAFKATRLAAQIELSIHLRHNIVQDTVFEILGFEKGNQPIGEIAFFITESPLMDVSDGLLEKGLADEPNPFLKIETRLQQLNDFLICILKERIVTDVIVIFSEGYDTEYQEMFVSTDSFVAECLNKLELCWGIPSLKVSIRKK